MAFNNPEMGKEIEKITSNKKNKRKLKAAAFLGAFLATSTPMEGQNQDSMNPQMDNKQATKEMTLENQEVMQKKIFGLLDDMRISGMYANEWYNSQGIIPNDAQREKKEIEMARDFLKKFTSKEYGNGKEEPTPDQLQKTFNEIRKNTGAFCEIALGDWQKTKTLEDATRVHPVFKIILDMEQENNKALEMLKNSDSK